MSEQVQRNMQVLRHWFDTLNKRDITEIRKAWEEIYTEDYVLHDPHEPGFSTGFEDSWKGVLSFVENYSELRVNVLDMFGAEDKVATAAILELVDASTQEKTKLMALVISRFEDGKIAEEWQIVQPIADPTV
jgi:ketosteroid isomerase-like protein